MHFVALPPWRGWYTYTMTWGGEVWNSPWQTWMHCPRSTLQIGWDWLLIGSMTHKQTHLYFNLSDKSFRVSQKMRLLRWPLSLLPHIRHNHKHLPVSQTRIPHLQSSPVMDQSHCLQSRYLYLKLPEKHLLVKNLMERDTDSSQVMHIGMIAEGNFLFTLKHYIYFIVISPCLWKFLKELKRQITQLTWKKKFGVFLCIFFAHH